jgi:hypothetical protein
MARPCSICKHTQRKEIDRALLGSELQAAIAGRFRVAQSSLSRHLHNHLVPAAANAIGRYETIDAERLRSWVNGLLEHAMFGLLRARQQDDDAGHRAYIAEARKTIELQAKLAGVIGDRPQVSIDARKQVAVLASNLSVDELRALARQAQMVDEGEKGSPASVGSPVGSDPVEASFRQAPRISGPQDAAGACSRASLGRLPS